MKATKKAFGAIALSAALALGTAIPAFAVDAVTDGAATASDVTAADAKFTNNSNDTIVNVVTKTSQLNASVPISMNIVADVNGGPIVAPTNYKIVNNGTAAIHVVSVKGVQEASSADGKWALQGSATDADATVTPGTGNIGKIFMKLGKQDTAGNNATLTTGTDFVVENNNTAEPKGWNIGTTSADKNFNIGIQGSTSQLSKAYDTTAPSKAVTLTYVIAYGDDPADAEV